MKTRRGMKSPIRVFINREINCKGKRRRRFHLNCVLMKPRRKLIDPFTSDVMCESRRAVLLPSTRLPARNDSFPVLCHLRFFIASAHLLTSALEVFFCLFTHSAVEVLQESLSIQELMSLTREGKKRKNLFNNFFRSVVVYAPKSFCFIPSWGWSLDCVTTFQLLLFILRG